MTTLALLDFAFITSVNTSSKQEMYLRIGKAVLPVKGLLTVLGATLLLISLALDFSYANLNTYVISYLRNKNPSITYADWIFVTTSKTFVQGLLMAFMGKLENKIGTRLCIFIGCVIYTGSITLTYFSIDHGLLPVVFSLSISHGIGFSLVYAQAIGAVIKWFIDNNKGLMASIAVGGYGFGAAIWIPIETAFVNPNNTKAVATNETDPKADKYFEDDDVLSRIPQLFLLLGAIFASLQVIGLALLRSPSKSELDEGSRLKENNTTENNMEPNLTIFQTISRKDFWLLWTIFMAVQLMQNFINSYQKSYGLEFINDDFFFSYVGLASNILNGSSRIVWGSLYDLKGFRFNAFLIGGVSTFLTWTFLLLYVIPSEEEMLQKAFFGIWLSGFYAFFPGIYASMAPVTQATFGHLNYSRDYGLLFTQSIFGSIVLTISAQFLYEFIDYIGMFSICGVMGIIGLLATWRFRPTAVS